MGSGNAILGDNNDDNDGSSVLTAFVHPFDDESIGDNHGFNICRWWCHISDCWYISNYTQKQKKTGSFGQNFHSSHGKKSINWWLYKGGYQEDGRRSYQG